MKVEVYELEAPRTLRLRELNLDATRPEPGEILAITEFSVISPGTELAAWEGQPPLRPSKVYPRLMGYCNLARVSAVGSAVRGIATGDYVLTHQSHRTGFACPATEILLTLPASTPQAQRRRFSAVYLYHLGHVALLAGNFTAGQRVAIIGLGTLGVATAALLLAQGAQPLVFTDQPPSPALGQLKLAQVFPKSAPPGEDPVAEIVINTSNRWADHRLALQLARHGGRIVCLGFPGRGQPLPDFNPLDSQYFYDKQLSLHHCGHVPNHSTLQQNLSRLAGLITSGALDPDLLITFEAHWRDLASIYAQLAERRPGVLAACLRWT